METRAKYATIGFFTLIVIALAFGFVYWLRRLDETGIRSTMFLEFPGTVSGLEPGGSVYFNGLKIGEVVRLSFDAADPNKIVVTASVRADTPIKTDTNAKVGTSILTGVAYIEMSGGSPKAKGIFEVEPAVLVGQSAGGDIMAAVNQVALKVDKVVERIDKIVGANEAAITETVNNVRDFTGALSKNSSGVADFLKNVSEMSKTIQGLSTKLTDLVDKADKVVAAIEPEKIRSAVANAEKAVKDIADASGGVVADVKKAASEISAFTGGLKDTLTKVQDVIGAIDKTRIASVVDSVAAFADKLKLAAPDFDKIVADVKSTSANVSKFADNLNAHTGDFNQIVADAKELSGRLNQTSKRLDSLLGKADDMLSTEGGKNFFQEAADAARSIKDVADRLNGRIDEIADGLSKFSSRGLENVDALVSDLRSTAARIDRVVGNLERNPSSLVFGGNSGVREYNRR